MSVKKTLIVTIVFALFAALIYFFEMPKQKQQKEKEDSDKKIMEMDWDSINRIELSSPRKKILLEKKQEQWKLSEPVKDLADKYQVTSIINALRFGEVENRLNKLEQPLSDYGLDPPGSTITLRAGGVTRTIEIGNKYSLGASLFIKLADSPEVLIVSDSLLSSAEKTVTQLRENKIFREDRGTVTGLKIEKQGEIFNLTKVPKENSDQFSWKFDQPSDFYADEKLVDDFINVAKNLIATDFVAENRASDEKYGLVSPTTSLTLTYSIESKTDDNKEENSEKPSTLSTISRTLLIGNESQKEGNYFAALDHLDFVVTLPADSVNNLMIDPFSLRDRHLVRDIKGKTAKISLQTSGSLAIITHSDPDWTFQDGRKTDPVRVNDLLNGIEEMQGTLLGEPGDAKPNKWLNRSKLKKNGINNKADWIELTDKEERPFLWLVKGNVNEILGSVIVADMLYKPPALYELAVEEMAFWPENISSFLPKEDSKVEGSAADDKSAQ